MLVLNSTTRLAGRERRDPSGMNAQKRNIKKQKSIKEPKPSKDKKRKAYCLVS
jgi:hypothetical protein